MERAELIRMWLNAKQAEDEAKKQRAEIESALLPLVESKENGSKTTAVDGFKVTVKMPVYYSLDVELWNQVKDSIPAELHPTKTKIEVDAKRYSALEEYPVLWDLAAGCITVKPGKPGFAIKEDDDA